MKTKIRKILEATYAYNVENDRVIKEIFEEIAKYYDNIETKGEMIYPSEVAFYLRHL